MNLIQLRADLLSFKAENPTWSTDPSLKAIAWKLQIAYERALFA